MISRKKIHLISCLVLLLGSGVVFYIFFGQLWDNKGYPPEEWLMRFRHEKAERRAAGILKSDRPNKFQEYFAAITTPFDSTGDMYAPGYKTRELERAIGDRVYLKSAQEKLPWVSRGPGNVSGRTRGLLIDPDDPVGNTWYAGSASGGVWKTTNGGQSWVELTPYLPNLATSTLAMSPAHTSVIYAGTGEGFFGVGMVKGDGIFRSPDKGLTWEHLDFTASNPDFSFVNRIIVNPTNENELVVCTNTGIFKSTDGGVSFLNTFRSTRRVQDLEFEPGDFSIQYAGVNGVGVIKSVNAGQSWSVSSKGMGDCLRVEVAVSPVNKGKVFASVEGPDLQTHVYISGDKGASWQFFKNSGTNNVNYLGEQGWYNNTIACHPYLENVVYVGGVYLGKYTFSGNTEQGPAQVLGVDTIGTGSYIDFVNFGGNYFAGALETGDVNGAIGLGTTDWTSVEIRFGPGLSQYAHRFTVPVGTGSGVPASQYTYQDYVEVPFQAWDIENNRQLMVSFRDQGRDGSFNLESRTTDITSREYLYVHALEYSGVPNPNVAKQAGHMYKQLYFFWPALKDGASWIPTNLPVSKVVITHGNLVYQLGTGEVVSDGRGDLGGKNGNLYVDHHNLIMIPISKTTGSFRILNANDGGIGLSNNSGENWVQITNGYISTQFYGVAKKRGALEYIGGMQDNGTHKSPANVTATIGTNFRKQIGGDGFDVIWHPERPDNIIASVYNNQFYLSRDNGRNWAKADQGIDSDGPFVTRLAYSVSNPDVIFAVGEEGVYRSKTFGYHRTDKWETISMGPGWTIDDNTVNQLQVASSLVDGNIVWAGAGLIKSPYLTLFVSTDQGVSFKPVPVPGVNGIGYISGLATHPSLPQTAYALFSYAQAPKILQTNDLGKSWTDISGFAGAEVSRNGFPDVVVNCLLVMPHEPEIIWVGTEIGLFESRNSGESWQYADNGLPAVSIWQMKIIDDQVVVATHGRGIWTLDLKDGLPGQSPPEFIPYPNPNNGTFKVLMQNENMGNYTIEVFDLMGRLVYKYIGEKTSLIHEDEIIIYRAGSGTYLVRVSLGKNVWTGKVMVHSNN